MISLIFQQQFLNSLLKIRESVLRMLKNKNIIITGANRGIGRAILETFAQFGANIFACARVQTQEFENLITELKNKYNTQIYPIYFDVSNKDEIKEGIKKINSYKIPIDCLVNNAGITQNSLYLMSTLDDVQKEFNINFNSVFLISQYIAKLMIRNSKGSIVNISSVSAKGGDIGRAVYGASKAAVSSLTKTMAAELGEKNIRVNALAPGFIKTDMMNFIGQEHIEENLKKSYLKRMGEAKEVANAAAFLCSDLSTYITGEIISVSGGLG